MVCRGDLKPFWFLVTKIWLSLARKTSEEQRTWEEVLFLLHSNYSFLHLLLGFLTDYICFDYSLQGYGSCENFLQGLGSGKPRGKGFVSVDVAFPVLFLRIQPDTKLRCTQLYRL